MDNKNKKRKKMIAPIVVTIIVLLYFSLMAIGFFTSDMPLLVKLLVAIIPLGLGGVITFVLIERIEEINGGEEDDLSKY